MPDIGCEGTLISAYITIPGYGNSLISKYENIKNVTKAKDSADGPQSPIQPNENK